MSFFSFPFTSSFLLLLAMASNLVALLHLSFLRMCVSLARPVASFSFCLRKRKAGSETAMRDYKRVPQHELWKLILLAWHLLLVARHLFLVAWHLLLLVRHLYWVVWDFCALYALYARIHSASVSAQLRWTMIALTSWSAGCSENLTRSFGQRPAQLVIWGNCKKVEWLGSIDWQAGALWNIETCRKRPEAKGEGDVCQA